MSHPVTLQRDRSLHALLDDAFTLLFRHLGPALLLTAIVVVPVELLLSGVVLGELTSGYDRDVSTNGGALVVGLVPLLVTTPLVMGMLVRLVRDDAEGNDVSIARCVRAGLGMFLYLLPAVLLVLVGVLVGFAAFIVPGIFLAIRWSVVAPVVAVEHEQGAAALRRSWQLVTGQGWFVFGAVLLLSIVVAIVGTLIALPFDRLAEDADRQVIALAGEVVGQIVGLPFSALATILLFFTLRARHGDRERPEEDRPAAPPGWEPPVAPR